MSGKNEMKASITVVLDRSGSMDSARDDTIGGFNAFLEAQKREPAGTTLTLTQFDHEYEIVCLDRPVAEVAPLTKASYVPRGRTALNDAIARTIVELGGRIDAAPAETRPERVVFVILTDGQENASVEFSTAEVRRLIERHEKERGWTFVFLGADMDAFAEAGRYGIDAARAYRYKSPRAGTKRAFEVVAERIAEHRRGADFAFTGDDRKKGA